MMLDSSIHSGGLFRAAVDYDPSSFLLSESNKTRNTNNPWFMRKYLTGKQRGSNMVGRIASREEGLTAQHRVTDPNLYWGATARFTFTDGEDTALGISILSYLSSGSVN